MLRRSISAVALFAILLPATIGRAEDAIPPKEIRVLPVFFVPKGEDAPTADQSAKLVQHLEAARKRYRELLSDRDTFAIADGKPRVYRSKNALAFLRTQLEGGAPQVVSELLADLKVNRYNCPYILLTVVMNGRDDFPTGGGRPLNGGFNTGGSIIVLSSFSLDRIPNFQSTLQHELGHGFGLPHVDAYGLDMKSNDSIMSYNPKHHTSGLTASKTPGKLNPEDLWGLSLNRRAFPKLAFDSNADVPKGYSLAANLAPLGPMKLPGVTDLRITTDSGEDAGSKVGNIVQGRIRESKKTGKVTYDGGVMWHSAKSKTGSVTVRVTFPFEVELTGVGVHSQHSGEYHAARAIRVSAADAKGKLLPVAKADLTAVDETVKLPKAKGAVWQFEFQAGESGIVVLRGLQFFSGDDELFPTLIPLKP